MPSLIEKLPNPFTELGGFTLQELQEVDLTDFDWNQEVEDYLRKELGEIRYRKLVLSQRILNMDDAHIFVQWYKKRYGD